MAGREIIGYGPQRYEMTKRNGINCKTSIPPFRRELYDNYRSKGYVCQNYCLRPGLPCPGFDSFLTQNG